MGLNFEHLRKYPTTYLLYVCIAAIIYLYFEQKFSIYQEIKDLKKENIEFRGDIRVLDSLLWDCQGKNNVTKTLKNVSSK